MQKGSDGGGRMETGKNFVTLIYMFVVREILLNGTSTSTSAAALPRQKSAALLQELFELNNNTITVGHGDSVGADVNCTSCIEWSRVWRLVQ